MIYPQIRELRFYVKIIIIKLSLLRYFTLENGASIKNFISDISDFALEKSCLEVFEIRKKSLHLQPQTIKAMRYSMNIITLKPKVSTGWILGCRVRYAHCSGN